MTAADFVQGTFYPPFAKLRNASAEIAVAVAHVAYQEELAARPKPDDPGRFTRSQVYEPRYRSYV